jgi:protein involved in ribonucleotide reduction
MERLGKPAHRIPIYAREEHLRVDDPYVLVLPTYGGGTNGGAVPKQVITFLNDEHNRSLIRGVIAAGNTNFGEAYGLAGDIVSRKCKVDTLYRF